MGRSTRNSQKAGQECQGEGVDAGDSAVKDSREKRKGETDKNGKKGQKGEKRKPPATGGIGNRWSEEVEFLTFGQAILQKDVTQTLRALGLKRLNTPVSVCLL